MDLVPTIDLRSGDSVSLEALDRACRDHGFFLLTGHGADELIERTAQQTRLFFEAPAEVRESVRRTEDRPTGYYDRELTKRLRDRKEVFDYTDPDTPKTAKRNQWPDALPGFRETQTEFFDTMSKLAAEILRMVHSALGLPSAVQDAHAGARMTSTVRLNHYLVGDPVPDAEREGLPPLADVALGHHTDPGLITLLLQDDTGGLQTLSQDAGWIDVPPQPGTIVVNLGDSLQVWSNDRYRAAIHRVVPPTAERYSIPYFYNPQLDAVIEPIEQPAGPDPLYRAFTWREFMRARIDDNYADVGAEDTQITQYRI